MGKENIPMVIKFFSFSFTCLAYSKSQLITMHRKIPGKSTCQLKGLNYHSVTDTETHGKYPHQKNEDFYKTTAVNDET
jgi:hypothetical protein